MTGTLKCIIYDTENGSKHLTSIANKCLTDTIEVFNVFVSNVQNVVQNKKDNSKTAKETSQNVDVRSMKSILLKKIEIGQDVMKKTSM